MAKKAPPKATPTPPQKAGVKNNDPAPAVAKKSWQPVTKYALFLGILAFCIYANTLQNGYAIDDKNAILNNTLVRQGIIAIPEILFTPYHHGTIIAQENGLAIGDLYRPLSLIMFAIEFQLFGDNPMVGHLFNILLYAGCVMLFFLFLHYLFKNKRPLIAFIAAFIFAIHPIHTEVVANIKSRDELLCFFFDFLALNIFFKFMDTNKKIFLVSGLFLYFLSLLSKESSITFIAIIPFIFFFFRNENKKRSIYISLLSLIPALIYLAIRFSVLISYHANNSSDLSLLENALIGAPSLSSRLATEILVLGYYIKLLVIPYPLVCDYSYNAIPFVNFGNISVWLSFVSYSFLIYFGISRLIKKQNDPVAFGILFFLVTISIFSNILLLIGAEMAERFLFFPSVGFCIIVALGIERLVFKTEISEFTTIKNKKALYILMPIVIIFICITVTRNNEWKDDITLFKADSKKSPNDFILHYYTSIKEIAISKEQGIDIATKQQMYEDGINDLKKSLAIYPDFGPAQDDYTYSFMIAKQPDSAEAHCNKALLINPNDVIAMNNLAIINIGKKKYNEAIALDRRASSINPTKSDYVGNIGVCYVKTNQADSAIYYFRKAITIDATNITFAKYLVAVFNVAGQQDSAKKYETIARRYDPNFKI